MLSLIHIQMCIRDRDSSSAWVGTQFQDHTQQTMIHHKLLFFLKSQSTCKCLCDRYSSLYTSFNKQYIYIADISSLTRNFILMCCCTLMLKMFPAEHRCTVHFKQTLGLKREYVTTVNGGDSIRHCPTLHNFVSFIHQQQQQQQKKQSDFFLYLK